MRYYTLILVLITTIHFFVGCKNQEKTEVKVKKRSQVSTLYKKRLEFLIKDSSIYTQLKVDREYLQIKSSQTNSIFKLQLNAIDQYQSLFESNKTKEEIISILKKGLPPSKSINEIEPANNDGDHFLPLNGKKIAIDPGHFGGSQNMAMLEKRYIHTKKDKNEYSFNEGNLTLITALLLKDTLEQMGAEVMMTRIPSKHSMIDSTSRLPNDFKKWIETDFKEYQTDKKSYKDLLKDFSNDEIIFFKDRLLLLKNTIDTALIFHSIYKHIDLRKREEKINMFNPDLTFVLHMNVGNGTINPTSLLTEISERNYSMTFVPGAFMENELKSDNDLFHFTRLLLTDHLDQSIKYAHKTQQYFIKKLKVPAIKKGSDIPYIKYGCVYTRKKGVFCRNLYLTRTITSPIIYGEPLCQDFMTETKALSNNNVKKNINGILIKYPERLDHLVASYVAAFN